MKWDPGVPAGSVLEELERPTGSREEGTTIPAAESSFFETLQPGYSYPPRYSRIIGSRAGPR